MYRIAPSPVRNLSAINIKSTTLDLTWVKPIAENGLVFYKIYQNSIMEETEKILSVKFNGTKYSVSEDLTPYTNYTFSVQAYTGVANFGQRVSLSVLTDSDSKHVYII